MKLDRVLVLNGPNLDMLGVREPGIYGDKTLGALENQVTDYGSELGVRVDCYQSNSEGKLIGKIHKARGTYDAIIYNPGAHTHYSYALRDAVAAIDVPVVEVHLSDIDAREAFRAKSVIAPACVAQIKGRGFDGYCDAIDVLATFDHLGRLGEGYEAKYTADDQGVTLARPENAVEGANFASLETLRESSERRVQQVRSVMAQVGIDAMLFRNTANIQWLTAFDDVFDTERAHALLVTPEACILHTDSRYATACQEAADALGSFIRVNQDRVAHPAFARDALKGLTEAQVKLGIENDVPLAEYSALVKAMDQTPITLMSTSGIGSNLRSVKDGAELARLRAAQAITDAAFSHIVDFMKPGMTERQVQLELEDFMRHHGAAGLAFSSIVACGPNAARAHSIPGDTRLEAGQCVVMDFGAKAAGYCSDMTRTVFLGEPAGKMARAWETLRRANEECEAMIAPGVTGAEVHQHAEEVLEQGGFGGAMGHALGHGVGLDEHEEPVLAPRNTKPLVAGNVVTVEPGIYLAGEFGMRLEDCGVVTDEGYERFSKSTHDAVII